MTEFNCFIRRAGILSDGRAQVDLKDMNGSFDWTWYLSSAARGREVLATAMVAIVNDLSVGVSIHDPVQPMAEIQGFFLVK